MNEIGKVLKGAGVTGYQVVMALLKKYPDCNKNTAFHWTYVKAGGRVCKPSYPWPERVKDVIWEMAEVNRKQTPDLLARLEALWT